MGLFDSAISNMSKLALNEDTVDIPQITSSAMVDEFKTTMDMMPSLTEEEMRFPAYAVPLRECGRLGKYLIEMEDISRYMLTNGITNLMEAIGNVGEENGIRLTQRNVALVLDESSVLQEMEDLGMNIGGSNSNEGNIGTVGLLGPHTDINKFRRFANSREFVDTVANKYGLPLVKKNYNIGLVPVKHGDIHHDGNIQEDFSMWDEEDLDPFDETMSSAQQNALSHRANQVTSYAKQAGLAGKTGSAFIKPTSSSMGSSSVAPKPPTSSGGIMGSSGSSSSVKVQTPTNPASTSGSHATPSIPTGGNTATAGFTNNEKYKGIADNNISPTDSIAVQRAKRQAQDAWVAQNGGSKRGFKEENEIEDPSIQYIRDLAMGKYDEELLSESYGGSSYIEPNYQ